MTTLVLALGLALAPLPARGDLAELARRSLAENIIELPSGPYLVAGQHQFKTLWTRDFCFSIGGLLASHHPEVVRNHLEALLRNRRPRDGLIPRVLDSVSVQMRVVLSSVGIGLPIRDPLVPTFLDEHGSEAIDSNTLVLLGALDYRETSGDEAWWRAARPALVEVFRYYRAHRRADGLLVQSPFSDWQDSVKREGVTFYANLLYFRVLSRLRGEPGFGIQADDVAEFRHRVDLIFFDSEAGLYRGLEGKPYLSLEGNLFALDWGFAAAPSALYDALKRSELWRGGAGIPGAATVPRYPASWKSFVVRLAGLGGYHDRVYWSWLVAYSAKIARRQGDLAESARILGELARVAERDGSVGEIYAARPALGGFRSWLYRSEIPFSWGSAFALEAALW